MKKMITYFLLLVTILLIGMYILPFIKLHLKKNNIIEGATGDTIIVAEDGNASSAGGTGPGPVPPAPGTVGTGPVLSGSVSVNTDSNTPVNNNYSANTPNKPFSDKEIEEKATMYKKTYPYITELEIKTIITNINNQAALLQLEKKDVLQSSSIKIEQKNKEAMSQMGISQPTTPSKDNTQSKDQDTALAAAALGAGGEIHYSNNIIQKDDGEFNPSNDMNVKALTAGSGALVDFMKQSYSSLKNNVAANVNAVDNDKANKDAALQKIYQTLFDRVNILSERIKQNNNRKQSKKNKQTEHHTHHNLDHTLKKQDTLIKKIQKEQDILIKNINKTIDHNKDDGAYVNKNNLLSCPKKPSVNEYVNKIFGIPTEEKKKEKKEISTKDTWIGTGFYNEPDNKTTESFIGSIQKKKKIKNIIFYFFFKFIFFF